MSSDNPERHTAENPRSLNILGVTGSIGKSAVDVILKHKELFDVRVVTAHKNAEELAHLAILLEASTAVISDEAHLPILKTLLSETGIQCFGGREALIEAAAQPVDMTLAAIVGMAGLEPLMSAIKHSNYVAVANKEPLVAAGEIVINSAKDYKTTLLPIDSEHNAIFQLFDSTQRESIERITLTASGGPFRTWSAEQMQSATPSQAVAHPNWSMGHKISVDSATLMNKGLELIEAHYLFDMSPEKIDVLIHPQSIVHSFVTYCDGSVLAQMGASDMRTPLSNILLYPRRLETSGQKLDLQTLSRLDFEAPDTERFPAIDLAYQCLIKGTYACAGLNAANEVAVDAFLKNSLDFTGIITVVGRVISELKPEILSTVSDIIAFDEAVRIKTQAYINEMATSEFNQRLSGG